MPVRRIRNAGSAQDKEQQSRELRKATLALFIQQFEKEELEARLENTLATVDKVFQVELMKMPPPLRSARIGDLISGESSVYSLPAVIYSSLILLGLIHLLNCLLRQRRRSLPAVCFSEETKDEINLDLLDDVAWCQIQQLKVISAHFLHFLNVCHYRSLRKGT
uniref:Borealin N-terminal domain-containing protein n=1 Tax=Monopterus albus TaxID=43700 RepID=A0A3Q3QTQ6_MONAL